MLYLRRVTVVLVLTVIAVLAAGPQPNVNPVPECLLGCQEFVGL